MHIRWLHYTAFFGVVTNGRYLYIIKVTTVLLLPMHPLRRCGTCVAYHMFACVIGNLVLLDTGRPP